MTSPDVDLSKCAMCGQPAQFTDTDPGANPVSYCSGCLPDHFRTRAVGGLMPLRTGATKTELYSQAQALNVDGRSSMSAPELESAVAAAVVQDADLVARRPGLAEVAETVDVEPKPATAPPAP